MSLRIESLLTLAIVLVIAVDAFVAMQVYQQNQDAAVVVPLAASVVAPPVTTPAAEPGSGEAGGEGENGVVAVTTGVTGRNAVQSAILAAQLAYVDAGAMPADSFAMQRLVPGPRFVDGAERAGSGVIGVVSTPTTILFVTALADSQWICAAIDGPSESTQYGSGETRGDVSEFAGCIGNISDWG